MSIDIAIESGYVAAVDKHIAVVTVKVPPGPKKEAHTLLLLDCSGSMAPVIGDVREDAQAFARGLGEDEFLSVILFSGHGRAKLIAGPTRCDTLGKNLLTNAIRVSVKVMDTTVFSEPLEIALHTARTLAPKDLKHNVVLFTDGCAVPTTWSYDKEKEMSYALAVKFGKERVALSTIGYGSHYDDAFLRALVAKAGGTGISRHVSEIEGFAGAAASVREAHGKTNGQVLSMTLHAEGAGRVHRARPEISIIGGAGSWRFTAHEENVFFVDVGGDDDFKVTTVVHDVVDVKGSTPCATLGRATLTKEREDEIVRLYAMLPYATMDRSNAGKMAMGEDLKSTVKVPLSADLLRSVGDAEAAEVFATSHTEREKRERGDEARRYFVNKRYIGKGLAREDKRFCALDVVRELIETEGNVVFLGDYKRTGELTVDVDDRVIQTPGRNLRLLSLQSHKERFNFSFKALKDVKVRPEGGGTPADMKMWRSYNVILDGNLHIPLLRASLSKQSFEVLAKAGLVCDYSPTALYELDLRKLPVISGNWAQPKFMGLVPLLREEADLEVRQTALNARCKALGGKASEEESGIYYPKSVKAEGAVQEFYTAQCCEWRLMDYKGEIGVFKKDIDTLNFEEVIAAVKQMRQRLQTVRFLSRAIIFATELAAPHVMPWSYPKVTKRGKNEKEERETDFDGARLKRVTWAEQEVCS